MKKVLVTGARGFVGKNLLAALGQDDDIEVLTFTGSSDPSELPLLCSQADFVYHLAGVNRPRDPGDFYTGNTGLTAEIITQMEQGGRAVPILLCSSTQAAFDNPYGLSKRQAEELVFAYGRRQAVPVYVYRLPNVFGKWCRPNYNSVVATFCHNIARGVPVTISDPSVTMTLAYIDDVVAAFVAAVDNRATVRDGFAVVEPLHTIKLGYIAHLLQGFKATRGDLALPDLTEPLTQKLYSTYLSYLPDNDFSYRLKMNVDQRGSFTEFIRTADRGQVSVNISKPGVTKGNHWHHSKNEKFLVVSGAGVVRLRKIGENKVVEYPVSGEELEVIDIPPGYTHNISNTGVTDMVTVMWVSEAFDPEMPDTYFEKVEL